MWYCDDEYKHRDEAKMDFRYGHSPSYEHYDRYSDDGCKRAYTDEYDRLAREERDRHERALEEQQREEAEERAARERASYEREMEEAYWAQQEEQERAYQESLAQEPPSQPSADELERGEG